MNNLDRTSYELIIVEGKTWEDDMHGEESSTYDYTYTFDTKEEVQKAVKFIKDKGNFNDFAQVDDFYVYEILDTSDRSGSHDDFSFSMRNTQITCLLNHNTW